MGMRKTWSATKANGQTTAIKVKTGTEAQKVNTAKALRAAGFTGVRDENGQCITCDNH